MRHEVQQRDKIRVSAEIVFAGVGYTGLSPTASLKRVADDMYWDGSAWSGSYVTFALSEVDATNQPGVYQRVVSDEADFFDPVLGADGYESVVVETTRNVRENLRIEVIDEVSETSGLALTVSPTLADGSEFVQARTTHRVNIGLSTSPAESGRAGSFIVNLAKLTVSTTVYDLTDNVDVVFSELVEAGRANGKTASVTASPLSLIHI